MQQTPNIVSGFKNNNFLPPTPLPIPQQQAPSVNQVQLPPPQTQMQLDQIVQQQIVPDLTPDVDTMSIFGFALQKKYVYIAIVIILGILAYFLWKWWYGPKKSKRRGQKEEQYEDDNEMYDEEEGHEVDDEEEEEAYIPPYKPRDGDKKKVD
jgi:hypothetical protein